LRNRTRRRESGEHYGGTNAGSQPKKRGKVFSGLDRGIVEKSPNDDLVSTKFQLSC
jgi:hypothetical protein